MNEVYTIIAELGERDMNVNIKSSVKYVYNERIFKILV